MVKQVSEGGLRPIAPGSLVRLQTQRSAEWLAKRGQTPRKTGPGMVGLYSEVGLILEADGDTLTVRTAENETFSSVVRAKQDSGFPRWRPLRMTEQFPPWSVTACAAFDLTPLYNG